ncbi:MAG TPA: hypothetical protein VK563_22905 [Puia sp.]|nr:hypothetical protein [Puia sp.]
MKNKKQYMRYLKLFPVLSFFLLVACSGNIGSGQGKAAANAANTDKASDGGSPTNAGNGQNAAAKPAGGIDQLMDTSKLKSEVNDLMQSISEGKPDTNKLKTAGADILSTAARVLSDSGISKMGDNPNDPSQAAAKNAMIKMRNAMGLTPGALDSLRKAAAQLDQR